MSTNTYKVEYECDCGIDYGACGVKCAIILKSNHSCDVHALYHTDGHIFLHKDSPQKTTVGGLDCFSENYLSALKKILTLKISNEDDLTDNEREVVFNKQIT